MAKRVFFSFHYDDVKSFRANVVRKHDITKESREDCGFFDASIWEDAKLHGTFAVKNLIHKGLLNTTISCVLIGTETWRRRWVKYEMLKSYDRGNKLLGVHINGVSDKNQQTFPLGKNVFDYLGFVISADGQTQTYYEHDGNHWKISQDMQPKNLTNMPKEFWNKGYKLSNWVQVYNWKSQDGYRNFSSWLDDAK